MGATAFTTGVRNLKLTPVNVDTVAAYTLGTEISVQGVRQANWTLNIESFEHRGDDALLEISQQVDKLTIEFELAGFNLEMFAALIGGTYCADALSTLTGTISSVGTAVTGVSTAFESEVRVGDVLTAEGKTATVASITSDTALVLTAAFSSDVTGATFHVKVGDRFTHDVQAVSSYYKVEFESLMVDNKMFEVTIAKAKVTSGPAGSLADKTPGSTTMQVTGVKVNNASVDAFTLVKSARANS